MPEIAEVARIVHHLRQSLVGKTLAVFKAQDDNNVFGKVGTSAAEVQKSLIGKKVLEAGQQGKYFWLIMSSPPHPVFHFGMTGWFDIRGQNTHYFDSPKVSKNLEEWPPKYWKFNLETKETPKVEAAFVDSRRFARIRLVDCKASEIRNTTPLKENGPDPVIDRDVLTEEWLVKKMRSKHVPVKALLLDQANISGIGNWVGDEILYHAKLHPEQYSDTFSDEQLKQLHTSIRHICQTAVDLLGDAEQFPDDWIFKHRWGKGKKDAKTTLPNGEKITFLTVGGRTSCVVLSVQKKTGPVAGDLNGNEKGKGGKKRKVEEDHGDDVEEEEEVPKSKAKGKATKKSKVMKDEVTDDEQKVSKTKGKGKAAKKSEAMKEETEDEDEKDVPKSKEKAKTTKKSKAPKEETEDEDEIKDPAEAVIAKGKRQPKPLKRASEPADIQSNSSAKRSKASTSKATQAKAKAGKESRKDVDGVESAQADGRRRSGRVTKK